MGNILKKCAEIVDDREKLIREKNMLLEGIKQIEDVVSEYNRQEVVHLKNKIKVIDEQLAELH